MPETQSTTSQPCGACGDFRLFADLPAELRAKIWKHTLPPQRLVSINCEGHAMVILRNRPDRPQALPTTPLPACLSVCTESRAEALRRYRVMFPTHRRPVGAFVDPDRDVVFFALRYRRLTCGPSQFEKVLELLDPAELARVRLAALDEWLLRGLFGYASRNPDGEVRAAVDLVRRYLPGLKELIFVSRAADNNRMDALTTVAGLVLAEPQEEDNPFKEQIENAMAHVAGRFPEWTWPQWRVQRTVCVPELAPDPTALLVERPVL